MTDFEKVLRETQSEETFKIISSSDKEFRNWLENLKTIAEEYSKLVTGNNAGHNGWIPCSERLPEKEEYSNRSAAATDYRKFVKEYAEV